jgi:NAD-dependent dihydropyrimidine dehydrogenase PreA subunit
MAAKSIRGLAAGRRRNAALVVYGRTACERVMGLLTPIFGPLASRMAADIFGGSTFGWMARIPALPPVLHRYAEIPVWRERVGAAPVALQSVAGIERDPAAEQRAFEEAPLPDFNRLHHEATEMSLEHGWAFFIPTFPRLMRGLRDIARVAKQSPAAAPGRASQRSRELAELIRAESKRLGLSEIGFAQGDVKYTFEGFADPSGYNVVVCVIEQDWAATQTAPSLRAERAAFRSYGELTARVAALASYIQGLGYMARPNEFASGEAMTIHYAVEAGLGQLGLNGQLLTPRAGSRARLALITTDAPVELDKPVDYGVHKICDTCQICVRRCPVGAIPKTRRPHRGVVKAKLNTARCYPTVVQAHGCAICMKTCPVQRYGLDAVRSHLLEHGTIMGKDSDELEGYVWPPDGRYYAPGEKPSIRSQEFLRPPGWKLDLNGPSGD